MATISSHCGKRLTAQATPRPGATNGAGSDGSSSDGSNGSSDGSSSSSSKPQEQQLSSRQTVLVSATLWAGGLARFGPWCPGGALEFVTMGAGPTWSDDDGDGRSSSSSSSADPSKAWGWGAKGWEGPASVVANPKTQVGGSGVGVHVMGAPPSDAGLVLDNTHAHAHSDTPTYPAHMLLTYRALSGAPRASRASCPRCRPTCGMSSSSSTLTARVTSCGGRCTRCRSTWGSRL